jgi:hypothetical protein
MAFASYLYSKYLLGIFDIGPVSVDHSNGKYSTVLYMPVNLIQVGPQMRSALGVERGSEIIPGKNSDTRIKSLPLDRPQIKGGGVHFNELNSNSPPPMRSALGVELR